MKRPNALLARIGHLYYREGISGPEIRRLLLTDGIQISDSSVQRSIREIEERGWVKPVLVLPNEDDLAGQLAQKYRLRDVQVVECAAGREKEDIGGAAARYLNRILEPRMKVGFTFGWTLYHLVQALAPCPAELEVFPLGADLRTDLNDPVPNALVAMMLAKCGPGSHGHQLHAALREDLPGVLLEANEEVLLQAQKVDVAVLGIGSLERPEEKGFCELLAHLDLSPEKLAEVHGAVAQVNYRLADHNGVEIAHRDLDALYSMVKVVTLEHFRDLAKTTKLVVGVGGGSFKVNALHAMLRSRTINVLVTDAGSAVSLLSRDFE